MNAMDFPIVECTSKIRIIQVVASGYIQLCVRVLEPQELVGSLAHRTGVGGRNSLGRDEHDGAN